MARQAPSAFVERLDAHHIHRERGDHHELAAGRFGKRACQVVARRTQIERCFERQDGARGHALHLAVHHHVHVIFLPIRAFLSRCRTYEHRVHGQKRGRIKREAFRILLVRCKECGERARCRTWTFAMRVAKKLLQTSWRRRIVSCRYFSVPLRKWYNCRAGLPCGLIK